VLALDEQAVYDTVLAEIEAGQACDAGSGSFWTRHVAVNPDDGYRVRFSRFGCAMGEQGAIVVAPGRGEASVEYYETAVDFIALGYGPIFVVDHRGQGFSPRLLPDPGKAHVGTFADYVTDLSAVVGAVTDDIDALGAPEDVPLWFMSNSMGGAIGLGYFQASGAENPFAAAALAGPMIRVNYISFVKRKQNWLNLQIYSEVGALLQANWRCNVVTLWNADRCTDYASPNTFGAYSPGTRMFQPDTERIMTHSRARFALRNALWDDIDWQSVASSEYEPDEIWTGPQIGGATNRWVQTTARFNKRMRQPENLEKMQTMPVMIMMGTQDLRGYRPYPDAADRPPDLGHAKWLCDDLNEISALQGRYICEFVAIEGGYHELFKESDPYRDTAIATIDWFFRSH
jgi:lysophospholipase